MISVWSWKCVLPSLIISCYFFFFCLLCQYWIFVSFFNLKYIYLSNLWALNHFAELTSTFSSNCIRLVSKKWNSFRLILYHDFFLFFLNIIGITKWLCLTVSISKFSDNFEMFSVNHLNQFIWILYSKIQKIKFQCLFFFALIFSFLEYSGLEILYKILFRRIFETKNKTYSCLLDLLLIIKWLWSGANLSLKWGYNRKHLILNTLKLTQLQI